MHFCLFVFSQTQCRPRWFYSLQQAWCSVRLIHWNDLKRTSATAPFIFIFIRVFLFLSLTCRIFLQAAEREWTNGPLNEHLIPIPSAEMSKGRSVCSAWWSNSRQLRPRFSSLQSVEWESQSDHNVSHNTLWACHSMCCHCVFYSTSSLEQSASWELLAQN